MPDPEAERVPVGTIVSYHGSVITSYKLYVINGYHDVLAERSTGPDALPPDVIAGHWPDNLAYSLFPAGVPYKFGNVRDLTIRYVRRQSFDVLRAPDAPGNSGAGGQSPFSDKEGWSTDTDREISRENYETVNLVREKGERA